MLFMFTLKLADKKVVKKSIFIGKNFKIARIPGNPLPQPNLKGQGHRIFTCLNPN